MKNIIFCLILYSLAAGSVISAEDYPKRIISVSPVLTEELYLLGCGDKIVGVSNFCDRPAEAEKKEKAGSLTDLNIEKILMLRPDVLLVTPITPPEQLNRLTGLGIKIHKFPYYRSFKDMCSQFMHLSEIVDRKEDARKIIEDVNNEAVILRGKVKGLAKPKVFVQVGSRPLFTAAGNTFINDLVSMAGGKNIAEAIKEPGLYTVEKVVRSNPDIIIITNMGIIAVEEKAKWLTFEKMNAVKNKRIHIVDQNKLCSPTPVGFIAILKELINIIHPETARDEKQKN